MTRRIRFTVVPAIICALILLIGLPVSASNSDRGIITLRDYFDMLASGNLESARLLWSEPVQERAYRFGIQYTGIPLKIDANSPIVRDIDLFRDKLIPAAREAESLEDNFYRLRYRTTIDSRAVERDYWVRLAGAYFWLTTPQDYYSRSWPVIESEYLRIHAHPKLGSFLNQAALDEADRFVAAMMDTLDIPDSLRTIVKNEKIEYYYADTDSTVELIVGHRTKGTLDLPTNDVISATFPHFHELTHLLVNIKLQNIPLFTMPLLREGIATRFGGRWGKSPASLLDLGAFLYRQQIVEFDSILTMDGFSTFSGADIAYPVAGVFTFYLLDQMGQDKFFELYRNMSGKFVDLYAMSVADVQQSFADALGKADWAEVQTDFDQYLGNRLREHAAAKPGADESGKALVARDDWSVYEDGDWLCFEFTTDDKDSVVGTLFWGPDDRLSDKQSALFFEHFKGDLPFEGYRYAVRFDRNEAGLYDYATNQLLAKYIVGISPADDYFSEANNRIAIQFKKSMAGSDLPDKGNTEFVRQ